MLGELAAQFPAEVLGNPALLLLRLAHPQLLGQWPDQALIALASLPNASEWVLRQVLTHPRADVQLAVATRPDLSPALLNEVARSRFWTIRERVTHKAEVELALLLQLARDEDYGVRLSLASRPHLPPEVCRVLAQDTHPLIRNLFAEYQ